jgi:hypothetical protein
MIGLQFTAASKSIAETERIRYDKNIMDQKIAASFLLLSLTLIACAGPIPAKKSEGPLTLGQTVAVREIRTDGFWFFQVAYEYPGKTAHENKSIISNGHCSK